MSLAQSDLRATFTKRGPFWCWHIWHISDDEHTYARARGVSLNEQSAVWGARRAMVGLIVKSHKREGTYYTVDGNELDRRARTDGP